MSEVNRPRAQALLGYMRHRPTCATWPGENYPMEWRESDRGVCTCGLEAALREAAAPVPQDVSARIFARTKALIETICRAMSANPTSTARSWVDPLREVFEDAEIKQLAVASTPSAWREALKQIANASYRVTTSALLGVRWVDSKDVDRLRQIARAALTAAGEQP